MLLSLPVVILSQVRLFASATIVQVPLTSSRRLHGRFLHITDIHPDPLYRFNATVASSYAETDAETSAAQRLSGYYGTPYSTCDAPLRFVNLTLDWLDREWADEVDFVICEHDDDNLNPRTLTEIYAMNTFIAARMEQIFTKRGIPVVPSLGLIRVLLQNILLPGPNEITNTYVSIWSSFIPFSSYQVFQRGAYYSREIIPGQVGVLSLNTMYFYESNKAVEGCTWKDTSDPGNLEFDWMEVQLGLFRDRGMKVWLIGHVPPTWDNYFPECYRRYLELSMMFRDTIVGHLYGFFFLPAADLEEKPAKGTLKEKKGRIHKSLKKHFKLVPDEDDMNETEWAVVNVSPSVVANPYLPGVRVFGYNTTGGENSTSVGTVMEIAKKNKDDKKKKKKAKKCKKKKNRDKWECRGIGKEWHTDAEAPARTNTLWSPLGYAQFWMPRLGDGTKDEAPTWELEYVTYPISALYETRWAPIPVRLLPDCLRDAENVTAEGELLAPYGLADLTVGSWAELARQLVEDKKMWRLFKKNMYLGG
ncbi:hypothetical protein BU17DRAFT_73241 [Hysterangium stoloniferum]|nr:hypothetical protein BU17DRAFT_73241 [Hysterangium stoloniferum]